MSGARPADRARRRPIWEIIARLQELDGTEEQRITLLSESDLYPRLIRIPLDYAAEHASQIGERISRNQAMAERSKKSAQRRPALLA